MDDLIPNDETDLNNYVNLNEGCFDVNNGEGTSSGGERQSINDLHQLNKAFNDCRIVNEFSGKSKENTLFWNPVTKSFQVKQYFPNVKEKNFQRDEYFQKVLNINEQLQKTKKPPQVCQGALYTINDKYQRDEYIENIISNKEQLLKKLSSSLKNNNHYIDPKFKAKFKKYKAVSFNPEVQVIYMIKKRSNNEVHLRGVEILSKEQDQQMRNCIMRATYSKKKTLLF